MQGNVGLEVMNSTNAELNWKTVTKGRRSRKSTARSFNGISKAGNSTSPKRVGDFSGSDSDKFSEAVCGQSSSGKSENVPIKKRRHLLQTPLCRPKSTSPRKHCPLTKDHEQLEYPSYSSGKKMSNWQARGADDSAKVGFGEGFDHILLHERPGCGYTDAGDFSGIELLAAAASMDEDNDNDKKEDLAAGEDPLLPKDSNASSSAAQSELGLNSSKSEASSSNALADEGSVECSLVTNNSAAVPKSSCRSVVCEAAPKINRQHWDLNTLMDAWDEPHDNSLTGNNPSKAVDDGSYMEDRWQPSRDPVLSTPAGTGDELRDVKMEEHNSVTVFPDRTCSELENIVACFRKDSETSNQATEKGANERNSDQILSRDAHKEILKQVLETDATLLSGGMMSKEIISTLSGTMTVMKDEDCSSNLSITESTAVPERIQKVTQDINVHCMSAPEASENALDDECKDSKESWKPRESPGSSIQDAQSLLITDSKIGNDGTLVPDSTNTDCQGLQTDELVTRPGDNSVPNEGSKEITIENSCKSSSAGPQCEDPSSSVGKIGSTFDTQHDSDISQDNHFDVVDGGALTRFDEGYDSPYEDGELRASFSYSWEDNEMENECVDYESDGRNGDGTNAADYPGLEIVEDGSEGSRGTQRGCSTVKGLPEGSESKTGPFRHSSRRYFAKDDSDNNTERAGKGSNAGSGTTVEQSMEMNVVENDDIMKKRQLTGRRETADVFKMAQMDEYASKMGRGKLQSHIEGRSSFDVHDGKDVFFLPQCRSRRLGFSYSRPERDMSPDKHVVRYRPAAHGEREGGRCLTTSWGSRRRYASTYQGSEGRIYTRPRSIAGEMDKIGGLDIHDPRQPANYMPKPLNRPVMRSPSERDNYFGVRKRMPFSRGINNYRTRGNYSQRPGRDFREDFEQSLPDDTGAPPMRFSSRYMTRRDRSFSPSAGRNVAHMPLPRRKSRSRSRTRSPGPWRNRRERILNVRRHSRSPDFRPEPRMERMRVPFQKPAFASDYGDGYISPQRNHPRWVEDYTFGDNHLRRRRSPVRVFKRTQRFDSSVGSSGRLKSDEYFRPAIRPGRFSFKPNYDDRNETMRRVLHSDNNTNIRRFRHNAAGGADDFETSNNLNNEADDARVTDREDKRSLKIQ